MNRTFDFLPLSEFDIKSLEGRSEKDVKLFAEQALMPAKKVLDPVTVVMIRNKAEVIDGSKRVLACIWIQENIEDEEIKARFALVPVQIFESVSVAERAIYSIVSNEHRSDNPLSAYHQMKKLIKKGKWKEYQQAFKLNPSTFKKLATLDNLKKQEEFFDAFEEGWVVMNTLFTVAKLDDARQKMCLNLMKSKEKLTQADIKSIKTAAAEKVLEAMDFDFNAPTQVPRDEMYVFVMPGDDQPSKIMNFQDAVSNRGSGVVYRLQAIGSK